MKENKSTTIEALYEEAVAAYEKQQRDEINGWLSNFAGHMTYLGMLGDITALKGDGEFDIQQYKDVYGYDTGYVIKFSAPVPFYITTVTLGNQISCYMGTSPITTSILIRSRLEFLQTLGEFISESKKEGE
jgi:hypothetical protein